MIAWKFDSFRVGVNTVWTLGDFGTNMSFPVKAVSLQLQVSLLLLRLMQLNDMHTVFSIFVYTCNCQLACFGNGTQFRDIHGIWSADLLIQLSKDAYRYHTTYGRLRPSAVHVLVSLLHKSKVYIHNTHSWQNWPESNGAQVTVHSICIHSIRSTTSFEQILNVQYPNAVVESLGRYFI